MYVKLCAFRYRLRRNHSKLDSSFFPLSTFHYTMPRNRNQYYITSQRPCVSWHRLEKSASTQTVPHKRPLEMCVSPPNNSATHTKLTTQPITSPSLPLTSPLNFPYGVWRDVIWRDECNYKLTGHTSRWSLTNTKTKEHVVFYGNLWYSMSICGILSQYLVFYANIWYSMPICGILSQYLVL